MISIGPRLEMGPEEVPLYKSTDGRKTVAAGWVAMNLRQTFGRQI